MFERSVLSEELHAHGVGVVLGNQDRQGAEEHRGEVDDELHEEDHVVDLANITLFLAEDAALVFDVFGVFLPRQVVRIYRLSAIKALNRLVFVPDFPRRAVAVEGGCRLTCSVVFIRTIGLVFSKPVLGCSAGNALGFCQGDLLLKQLGLLLLLHVFAPKSFHLLLALLDEPPQVLDPNDDARYSDLVDTQQEEH